MRGGSPGYSEDEQGIGTGSAGAALQPAADRFDRYSARLAGGPDPAVRAEFGRFLAGHAPLLPHPKVDEALIRALEEIWVSPEVLALPVARYLAAKWPRALTGVAAPGEPQLLAVLRDPLLLALLRATPAATPGLEILLARFRHSALRAVRAGQDLRAFLPTLAALAIRGWHSGYALTLPLIDRHADARAEELALVAELGRWLESGEAAGPGLAAAIAVYASYAPPEGRHLGAAAAHPIAALIEERVVRPRRLQRDIAASLVPATSVGTDSAIVAEQYETHPYPAWIGEPDEAPALPAAVERAFGPVGAKAARSVLVAGCGTGLHALAAARTWPSADILAVDLSRASLAYAIDRSRQAGLARIEFALADLLEIGRLGRRFEVIETMGVLHHLADPAAGLRALVEVLDPGGVIGIALYSTAARGGLTAVRALYGEPAETDEEVRRFRAWALAGIDAPELLYAPDFYSLGGCRDALFHVRERTYSLPEVEALLGGAGLELLALQPPPAAATLAGPLPGPTDLTGWAAAERSHPRLFISMYEVWARKPD